MKIVLYPDPALTSKALPVEFPLTEEGKKGLESLLFGMKEVMLNGNGVGLAANQVGVLLRVIVIKQHPFECINPSFRVVDNTELVEMEEGCLSQPGRKVNVIRPNQIWVEYYTRTGKQVKSRMGGTLARIYLHEVDHLDGINIGIKS